MVFRLQQPPWYQDYSENQMKHLLFLDETMRIDYEEMVTVRTHRSLTGIGVFSSFFHIPSKNIRKLQRRSKFKTVIFLQEIYKILTGSYFEDEELKAEYGCNERLVLSGIALLTLPEAILELHKRLPPVIMPKLPPKPKLPIAPRIQKRISPYQEDLIAGCNWSTYRHWLDKWHEESKIIAIPKIILPDTGKNFSSNLNKQNLDVYTTKKVQKYKKDHAKGKKTRTKRLRGGSTQIRENNSNQKSTVMPTTFSFIENRSIQNILEYKANITDEVSPALDSTCFPDENKVFEFTFPDITQKSVLAESDMCDIPKSSTQEIMSRPEEKDHHCIISGVSTDLQSSPITYKMSGIENATTHNSDETFCTQLNREFDCTKVYPRGRKDLPRKWQEWLQNIDEEFKIIERHANKILEDVENTIKLTLAGPVCDNCCSCRQARKMDLKSKETKMPYVVIETLARNTDKTNIVLGSLAMHSLGPSPSASNEMIEVIPSENIITTKPIVHGSNKGVNNEIKHLVSDFQQHKLHLPSKIIERPLCKTLKAMPPCACDIKKTFKKSNTTTESFDDNLWAKSNGLCYGKKSRPEELPAYSCDLYPADKSCRKIPFKADTLKLKENAYQPSPCRNKPKLAVGRHPWKTIIPRETHTVLGERVEVGEMQEMGFERDEELKTSTMSEEMRKRATYRDEVSFNSPQSLAIRKKKAGALKTKRFIPNLSYPAYDDPWNILRTAPAEDDEVTDYEKSLKLSFPQQELNPKKSVDSPKIIKYNKFQNTTENNLYEVRLRGGSLEVKKNEEKLKYNKIEENQRHIANRIPYNEIKTKKETKLSDFHEEVESKYQQSIENRLLDDSSYDSGKDIEEKGITKGPCGWRTKSEQELPVKKNMIHLVEPDYPTQMISVRPGGRSCVCRENRNKKKIQMYAISGLSDEKEGGKKTGNRLSNRSGDVGINQRILEGVFYYTPPPSPRKSDEYVTEYELYESPYEKCVSHNRDTNLRQTEMYPNKTYSTPKKTSFEGCVGSNQYNYKTRDSVQCDKPEWTQTVRQDLIDSQISEKAWDMALNDISLNEYFTGNECTAPCWLKSLCKNVTPEKKLKVMKPVCECKYERKVLERNDEKFKWKERQYKLKRFEKQPYVSIDNSLRLNEMKRKLMVTDTQRIPRDDEYFDDIKYCVSGISENYVPLPPKIIVAGISMLSPVVTPETSKLDISLNQAHKPWSLVNISPDPSPTENNVLIKSTEFQEEQYVTAAHKTYHPNTPQIYQNQCNHDNTYLSRAPRVDENSNLGKIQYRVRNNLENTPNFTKRKTTYRERAGGYNKQPTKNNISIQDSSNAKESERSLSKGKLREIMKVELQKMCKEDFLFAKLPKCYLMPQLQIWLIYRYGFMITDTEQQKQIIDSLKVWNKLIVKHRTKIEAPALDLPKRETHYKKIKEVENKIKTKKAEFFSQIRQTRVIETRVWWPSMNFFEFRNASFKNAFFTYMANKEADGHVFKPWKPSETLQKRQ